MNFSSVTWDPLCHFPSPSVLARGRAQVTGSGSKEEQASEVEGEQGHSHTYEGSCGCCLPCRRLAVSACSFESQEVTPISPLYHPLQLVIVPTSGWPTRRSSSDLSQFLSDRFEIIPDIFTHCPSSFGRDMAPAPSRIKSADEPRNKTNSL